jgi:hypothetical protein
VKLYTDITTCLFEMVPAPSAELDAGLDIVLPLWDAQELEKEHSRFDSEDSSPGPKVYILCQPWFIPLISISCASILVGWLLTFLLEMF